ncbi:MAG: DUF2335 domain-containing protein [Candidatus Moraniibacteriota bacterium]|nr:MAG: DUF2335 domain-containing protein [Candidatus Moranbacteria bacterium]
MENGRIVASDKESQYPEQGVVTERRLEMYAGPLPHPDLLKRYREIVPDAPERILRMAEKQNEHRIEIEKKVISGNIWNERLGLIAGFSVCLYALYLGTQILMSGHEGYGFSAILSALASLVGVYIYTKHTESRQQKEER